MNRIQREKRDAKILEWWTNGAMDRDWARYADHFGLSRPTLERIVGHVQRHYDPEDRANPAHYRDGRGECIDAMPAHFRDWLLAEAGIGGPHEPQGDLGAPKIVRWMMLGFCVGSAFKYRWRRGRKDDVGKEDAKAAWYDAFAEHLITPEAGLDPRNKR
jgi:hypothetical protein